MIPYDREIVKHSIIYWYAILATPLKRFFWGGGGATTQLYLAVPGLFKYLLKGCRSFRFIYPQSSAKCYNWLK